MTELIHLKIFYDGAVWCAQLGEDDDCHLGWGFTILEAIKDFTDSWDAPYAPGGEKYRGKLK
jgi:hypothetical protein